MTEQQKKDAIKYIEGQLECGYVDLGGVVDKYELEIVKEAIDLWKAMEKFNGIGCTSWRFTAEELKEIMEGQENGSEFAMTRNEFIKLLKDNLKPNAQMDFLVCDYNKPVIAFLDIHDVCMNADVDDPENKNRGGIVFEIKENLTT